MVRMSLNTAPMLTQALYLAKGCILWPFKADSHTFKMFLQPLPMRLSFGLRICVCAFILAMSDRLCLNKYSSCAIGFFMDFSIEHGLWLFLEVATKNWHCLCMMTSFFCIFCNFWETMLFSHNVLCLCSSKWGSIFTQRDLDSILSVFLWCTCKQTSSDHFPVRRSSFILDIFSSPFAYPQLPKKSFKTGGSRILRSDTLWFWKFCVDSLCHFWETNGVYSLHPTNSNWECQQSVCLDHFYMTILEVSIVPDDVDTFLSCLFTMEEYVKNAHIHVLSLEINNHVPVTSFVFMVKL